MKKKVEKTKKAEEISMTYRGVIPFKKFFVNSHYILAIYNGSLSEYDIVIRYRYLENGKWSRIRTPKHIHWAVDILMKQSFNKKETKSFLELLQSKWETLPAIKDDMLKKFLLETDLLMHDVEKEAKNYAKMAKKGEYSIKFLYLLAKLLMIQEKTNNNNAYMFKALLEALKEQKDIYKVVQIATGRYAKR